MQVTRLLLVLAGLTLAAAVTGCGETRTALATACENAIKQRLADPASFRLLDIDETRRTLTAEEYLQRAGVTAWGRESIEAGIAGNDPPQLLQARVEYEASSASGVALRLVDDCAFVAGNDYAARHVADATDLLELDGQMYAAWLVAQAK